MYNHVTLTVISQVTVTGDTLLNQNQDNNSAYKIKIY